MIELTANCQLIEISTFCIACVDNISQASAYFLFDIIIYLPGTETHCNNGFIDGTLGRFPHPDFDWIYYIAFQILFSKKFSISTNYKNNTINLKNIIRLNYFFIA
jgi:hypothetical protein